eukprot:gene27987-34602_t
MDSEEVEPRRAKPHTVYYVPLLSSDKEMEQFDGELQSAAKTEEPKLKDSVMPAPVMPAPNASCRQLAKVKRCSIDTLVIDGGDYPTNQSQYQYGG